jgi:hypothetical protein
MSSSDVDLDRLADYVGGALDGTPDADAVRHLVETDPSWRRAHIDLVDALPAVRLDLSRLRDLDPVMPADLAARLDRALAASPVPKSNVVSLAERRGRRQRWLTAAGVAASIAVCSIVGVSVVRNGGITNDTSAGGDVRFSQEDNSGTRLNKDSPGGAGQPGVAPPAAAGNVISSGNDYAIGEWGSLPSSPARALDQTEARGPAAMNAPAPLARLLDPAARAKCLNAITREYGGTVSLVDFAKFQGVPAVVVVLTGTKVAAGGRWIVVVGPTCGENDAITDERYNGAI